MGKVLKSMILCVNSRQNFPKIFGNGVAIGELALNI
jgi:hypothetical protein